ncbi:MAG: hypothetical protein GXO26_09075 [Crenarchaeota archaeon]|nr:hypothetical protein [Thermoproteota archaeon]
MSEDKVRKLLDLLKAASRAYAHVGKWKKITINVPEETYKQIRKIAKELGIPYTRFLTYLVMLFIGTGLLSDNAEIIEKLDKLHEKIDRLLNEIEKLREKMSKVPITEPRSVTTVTEEEKTRKEETTETVREKGSGFDVPDFLRDNPWVQVIRGRSRERF